LNKKGYYFTLDAFIALIILSIGFIVITSNYSYAPAEVSTQQIANDILNVLQSAKIDDICDPDCSGTVLNTYSSLIKNKDNTLLEFIGELRKRGKIQKAKDLIDDIIPNIVPFNYNYAFELDGTVFVSDLASNMAELENKDEYKKSKIIISSKRIIISYYIDSAANVQYWGPYEAKVRVWQK